MEKKERKLEGYLLEKRVEIIWAMSLQDYSLSQIASIFSLSKTAIFKIIKKRPSDWVSPWRKMKKIEVSYIEPLTKHKNTGLYISTYCAWHSLKQRCKNKKNPGYKNYGGRGITYTRRWEDFVNFLVDMGIKPDKTLSIDRIDNDGPYCKKNCRWATAKQQQNNKRKRLYE
ncbi:MAG: hypothetical protein NUW00_04715 [Candidatus Kaiserbacteria bacterium]|nr:hypothetical protein [Candidatus Kaiserbacteria bacterium]